jgi:hypothetical protein
MSSYKDSAVAKAAMPDWKGEKDLQVLSYALWINDLKHPRPTKPPSSYVGGMIENCELATKFFPDWRVSVYVCDKLANACPKLVPRLEDLGANVTLYDNTPFWLGLFIRLLVMADPCVKRFCLRDTDSRLGSKDQAAVREWLESGHKWHAMRDHPCHGVPLLGCAWGGPGMSYKRVRQGIWRWMQHDFKKGSDQRFLAKKVWPTAVQDCLQHDSQFGSRFGKTRPFPKYSNYPYKFLFQTVQSNKECWKGILSDELESVRHKVGKK